MGARLAAEVVLYRYLAGIPWRDLPDQFGFWKTVRSCHRRYAGDGVLTAELFDDEAVTEFDDEPGTETPCPLWQAGRSWSWRRRDRQRCRGGLLTELGHNRRLRRGLIHDGALRRLSGHERGEGNAVHHPGVAAGGLVDDRDGILGKQGV
jgi:hypothetical protein